MKYLILILIFIFSIPISGDSQGLTEAVRYSTLLSGGTARTLGAGGSFGAMGGDFGVLGINPAGLADYRSNELMISFSINAGETTSLLEGGNSINTSHDNEFILENVGAVFHSAPGGSELQTSNLAIGLVQYNNFTENFGFRGMTTGSITERFLELAHGREPDELDDFEAGLGYESGAIYDLDNDLNYESDIDSLETVFKRQDVSRSGRINELVFAWGGRFDNNLALGVAIGVPFISFEEDKVYQEIDQNNTIPIFNDLSYTERLSTSGTGINLKLGLNYMIENTFRFGLAWQSPTFFTITDNYITQLNYDFTIDDENFDFTSSSPDGFFKYRLKTPMRLTGSAGALIKGDDLNGFINLDVQYLNYMNNSFNFTAFSSNAAEADFEREVNQEIDDELQSAVNFNLGGELAIDKFRLRAGLGLVGSPYFVDGSSEFRKIYSFGAGIRGSRVFLDLAYQIRNQSSGYIPYRILTTERQPFVSNESDISKLTLTLGFKI